MVEFVWMPVCWPRSHGGVLVNTEVELCYCAVGCRLHPLSTRAVICPDGGD